MARHEDTEGGREEVQDHYEGHEIDIDTAVDRFSILEDGAKDSPVMTKATADDDTEATLGSKTQENPNDPYCTC